MDNLFQALNVINSDTPCNFFFWCTFSQLAVIQKVAEKAGFGQFLTYTWCKPLNATYGFHRFSPSTEVALYGAKQLANGKFYHPRHSIHCHERPNFVFMPAVRNFLRDEKGEVINFSEKPIALASHIMRIIVPKGATVLVLGYGSGSEVCGALAAGLNVVGVENDQRQLKAAQSRVRAFALDIEAKSAAVASYLDRLHQSMTIVFKGLGQKKSAAEAAASIDKVDLTPAVIEPKDAAAPDAMCGVCSEVFVEEKGHRCDECRTFICGKRECFYDCVVCSAAKHVYCSAQCHDTVAPRHPSPASSSTSSSSSSSSSRT